MINADTCISCSSFSHGGWSKYDEYNRLRSDFLPTIPLSVKNRISSSEFNLLYSPLIKERASLDSFYCKNMCPVGFYCPDENNVYKIVECPVGRFRQSVQESAKECRECPMGMFADSTKNIECKSCEVGKYSGNSSSQLCEIW